jgi:hypothetical protein
MTTPQGWPERMAGTCSDGDALDLRHPDARRTGRQKDRGNNMHSVPPIPERTTRTAHIESGALWQSQASVLCSPAGTKAVRLVAFWAPIGIRVAPTSARAGTWC